MSNTKLLSDLLDDYRDASWESGWYAGVFEKVNQTMSFGEKAEYTAKQTAIIVKRTELRMKIDALLRGDA